ncbi:MAG: ABC transporter permease [Salibacteraceae bacterium]
MIRGRRAKLTGRGTSAIVKIAVTGIAVGMAVMILSIGIVNGFQHEIQQKVIGFGAHLQISQYNPSNTMGVKPVNIQQDFLKPLSQDSRVQNISAYAYKSGIIAVNGEIKGVVAKGIASDFDWEFFESNMIEGQPLSIRYHSKTDSVVISKLITDKLNLSLGDKITVVFVQDQKERKRRFTIGGIYESGMEQFDANIMLCDMRHVQKLNNWSDDQVAGFEVTLEKFDDLDHLDELIEEHVPWEFSSLKITDQFMEIFGWLELQDLNVFIILALMVLVSGINMITALLVFILERTNMIGLLKAMGANTKSLSLIFIYNAAYLILIGTLWGNAIGLGLGYLQMHFEFIKLDQSSYYIDHVPVLFEWNTLLLINIGSILVSILMLILPSLIVSRIDPVKTIRFN